VNVGTKGSVRIASFVLVGSVGFVVDATLLSALVHGLGWGVYAARTLSFTTAVTVTWFCNRRWVFQPTRDMRREYGAYVSTQLVGAGVNLGSYVLLVQLVPELAIMPVVPLAAGAMLALLFNYSAASRWVFANRPLDGETAK